MIDILRLIALDEPSGDVAGITPADTTTPEAGTQETPDIPSGGEVSTPTTPNTYDFDGEQITADQIREWKMSNMRQQDYTARLQQVTQMQQQAQDALELYNYLKGKPELAQKLQELDSGVTQNPNLMNAVNNTNPMMERLNALEANNIQMQIQNELSSILGKDKDVTDVELINIATANNVRITQAYEIWKGQNFDKLMQKKLAESSKQITQNIEKNNGITKTLIGEADKTNTSDVNFGLAENELSFAAKIGMTPEEYSKWKNK